jgi:exopolysaccharide biosynthesis WecB/TagA/CpsF family protein
MFLTNYLRHKYHKQIERVYGPELMLAILKQKQATSSKDKHYFLAANKKSMLALQKIHQKKYSLVPAVFDFLPYNINQQTETKYLKKIVMAKPQFIWLGIGSPKQVQLASWLKKHQLSALIICVGAAFDFVSHSKKQAPSWIRKNNLEWLFRLITEPKRLWRRYLIVIPKYLLSLLGKNYEHNQTKHQILITGAEFYWRHLVKYLRQKGYQYIRAVDIKPLSKWYQVDTQAENLVLNLDNLKNCQLATQDIDEVYNLAANMGGMGFIEKNKALCMLNVLINTNLLMAAKEAKVKRFFYASSACVYALSKQRNTQSKGLKESDAYPAQPEDGYGWEKLFAERMCRHFMEDFKLETRVARFHNVYGPLGEYQGGREKAPAALIRKVIEAKKSNKHEIEIWGDGQQTRTFMYIDDCVKGIDLIMHSEIKEPVNLGTSELVSINQLVSIIEKSLN